MPARVGQVGHFLAVGLIAGVRTSLVCRVTRSARATFSSPDPSMVTPDVSLGSDTTRDNGAIRRDVGVSIGSIAKRQLAPLGVAELGAPELRRR